MKKVLGVIFAVTFLFWSCDTDNLETQIPQEEQQKVDLGVDSGELSRIAENTAGRQCHSMNVLARQLKENPGMLQRMQNIETHTRNFEKPGGGNGNGNGGGGNGGDDGSGGSDNLGVINIPVYVHVIYSNSQQNISNTQVNSQIAVLNKDFRATNNDINNVPSEFSGLVADSEIQFTLAGTYRHSDSRSSWGTNDAMKAAYPPITPETHLNIWVCNIGGGILGYAQFPGGSASTDGIVVGHQYFGSQGYVSAPFDEGRTATHEVGHYLNLRHIWGDGRCKRDDYVSDTPSSDGPNYGCPSYPTVNCRSNDMT
ncbi:MAG: zinc metalloprotease, partial [Flavobacteriaceae bacterium]|nr:zinc metalloprotease [Flavobacteriaceae bacterium]